MTGLVDGVFAGHAVAEGLCVFGHAVFQRFWRGVFGGFVGVFFSEAVAESGFAFGHSLGKWLGGFGGCGFFLCGSAGDALFAAGDAASGPLGCSKVSPADGILRALGVAAATVHGILGARFFDGFEELRGFGEFLLDVLGAACGSGHGGGEGIRFWFAHPGGDGLLEVAIEILLILERLGLLFVASGEGFGDLEVELEGCLLFFVGFLLLFLLLGEFFVGLRDLAFNQFVELFGGVELLIHAADALGLLVGLPGDGVGEGEVAFEEGLGACDLVANLRPTIGEPVDLWLEICPEGKGFGHALACGVGFFPCALEFACGGSGGEPCFC